MFIKATEWTGAEHGERIMTSQEMTIEQATGKTIADLFHLWNESTDGFELVTTTGGWELVAVGDHPDEVWDMEVWRRGDVTVFGCQVGREGTIQAVVLYADDTDELEDATDIDRPAVRRLERMVNGVGEWGSWLLVDDGVTRWWVDAGDITTELMDSCDSYQDVCDAVAAFRDEEIPIAVLRAARKHYGKVDIAFGW